MRFVSIGWIINNKKKNKHLDINKGLIKFAKKNIMCRVKVLHTTQASLTTIEQRKNAKKTMSLRQIQLTLDCVRRYADKKNIAWDVAFSELKENKGLDYLITKSKSTNVPISQIMLKLNKY